jgi:hypothetical protein
MNITLPVAELTSREPDSSLQRPLGPDTNALCPPNVAGFSGEAERSEVSSAASRCWAARLGTSQQRETQPRNTLSRREEPS